MNNVMQSWYARNIATPGLNSKENPPSLHELRGSYNFNRPHRTATSLPNNYTMNSSSISQLQKKSEGKTCFNPYIGTDAGNKTRPQQCRVAAPTKIVNCDRDHIPMSQLTSPFESSGHGNRHSKDNNGRQRIPTRGAVDGMTELSRGISPFNSNRSEVDLTASSTNFSRIHNASGRDSFPSCVSQRTGTESRVFHPSNGSFLAQENKNSQGCHSNIHSAPTNSQNTSQTSAYSNQFLSNESTGSGIPQFQVKKYDFSQRSCPPSNSQERYHDNDANLHAIIDNHIRAVLNQRLAPELKELDNRQLSFYRRISEADEKHIECIKAVDRKHAACIEQIKELDKRSSNIDHQFLNVTKTIAKYTIEMEKQVVEFHTKGLYVENLYNKVTEMLKSIESSTKNFNEIVANSISSIKQAHETVMESTLPFIKQKASEIMTSLAAGLGLNRTTDSKEVVSESDDEELNDSYKQFLSVPTRSKGLRKSQKEKCFSKEAKNTETNVCASAEHKALKDKSVEGSPGLLCPLNFKKVNNDAYKQSSPLKVVASSGKIGKLSKLALTNKGKCRSPNATAQGKSTKQDKHLKVKLLYPTVQLKQSSHSTFPARNSEAKMHPLPATISKKVQSPTGNMEELSNVYRAKMGKCSSLMNGTVEEKSKNPLKGTLSFRTVQGYQPNHNTTPRPSKVVSPFASTESKQFDNVMIYTPLPSVPVVACSQSSETRSRNISAHGANLRPGNVCSPSRKRKVAEKHSTKKRTRSRYGHVSTMFEDDEVEYGFLSK